MGDLDGMEGVGVPVINTAASATVEKVFDEIYNGGVLPSVEEVRVLMTHLLQCVAGIYFQRDESLQNINLSKITSYTV